MSEPSRRLARKLAAYAAAGTSSLVAGQVGEVAAAIVHVDLGPGGQVANEYYPAYIDFDQDGVVEFSLTTGSTYRDCGHNSNYASGRDWIRIVAAVVGNLIVDAGQPIAPGSLVRTSSTGEPSVTLFRRSSSNCSGSLGTWTSSVPFRGVERGFVGLVFRGEDNALHAGWVDLASGGNLLMGYAYETEPGRPIAAGAVPEPPSLVLLAAGAAGLAVLRRRRAAARSA